MPFLVDLIWRAIQSAVASIGTTLFGIIFALTIAVLSSILRLRKTGDWKAAFKQHWQANLKHFATITVLAWGLLLTYHLLHIMHDIRERAAQVPLPPVPISSIVVPSAPDTGPPPTSANRVQAVKLLFKDSPLLTPRRQETLKSTINAFYDYLNAVGIEACKDVPPIGTRRGTFGTSGMYPGPLYVDSIYLPENQLDNPRTGPYAYAMYCFPIILGVYSANGVTDYRPERAAWVFQSYFVSSYLNSMPASANKSDIAKWIDVLWDIRETFGKGYADSLAVFTLKAFKDFSPGNRDVDFSPYFLQSLTAAQSVRDNFGADRSKSEQIQEILANHGLR
jgi:hypothetical protein